MLTKARIAITAPAAARYGLPAHVHQPVLLARERRDARLGMPQDRSQRRQRRGIDVQALTLQFRTDHRRKYLDDWINRLQVLGCVLIGNQQGPPALELLRDLRHVGQRAGPADRGPETAADVLGRERQDEIFLAHAPGRHERQVRPHALQEIDRLALELRILNLIVLRSR